MAIFEKIKSAYSAYMLMLVVVIGIFLIIVDGTLLKKRQLKKEEKISKALGYIYVVLGIGSYIIFAIF
ncbi:CLC_0170 family protein [Alkaliphilus peptidifermentans]|nr:CLC_0170 family protein [Alkaliphilus peptidifermentans]